MSITIRQIAEAANVSRGTVDKVLNNRPGVSLAVRSRIQQLAAELGYKPNAAGKSLAFQKNPMRIGVLLPNARDPFYKDIQAGIEKAAGELAGLGVEVVCRIMERLSVAEELACIREMVQLPLAGLILSPLDDPAVSDELNRLIDKRGLRVVTFNSDLESVNRLCFVGQDLKRSGRVAGELVGQLLPSGGRVLVISGLSRFKAHRERLEGFCELLAEVHPKVLIAETVLDVTDNELAYQAAFKALSQTDAPDAIYLTGLGVSGAARALVERGRPPVKLVCYDRVPETAALLKQRIINFTITQDPLAQGYLPIKILFDHVFNGIRPESDQIFTRTEILTAENV